MGVNQLFDYIEKEPEEWKEFIKSPDNPDEMKGIKKKIKTGRPLRTNDFIERFEEQINIFYMTRYVGN